MTRLKSRAMLAGILLCCSTAFAAYYMQDFFPIGFTGFENTHYSYWDYAPAPWDGSPYPDSLNLYPYGTWAKEKELLDSTHCNFIGCADAYQYYYMRLAPTTDPEVGGYGMDFYNKVCRPLNIMMAPNSCYTIYRQDKNGDGSLTNPAIDTIDTIINGRDTTIYRNLGNEEADPDDRIWWAILRHYDGGYAPDSFRTCPYNSIPQKSIWGPMADMGAHSYAAYFDSTGTNDDCFWGYDPFHEEYSMYRGGEHGYTFTPGVYAADTFVLKSIRSEEDTGSSPLRGPNRMIIAKGGLYPLMQQVGGGEINIFQYVPDIDMILIYNNQPRGYQAYGSQDFFDLFLYGYTKNPKAGYHNAAVYMQRYGDTPGGPAGQKRRWMPGLQLNWMMWYYFSDDTTYKQTPPPNGEGEYVLYRRPCQPEIRAMAYLCLSRGAKGMLFYPYLMWKLKKYVNPTYPTTDSVVSQRLFPTDKDMHVVPSSIQLSGTLDNMCYIGLRDATSKPCDTSVYSGPVLLDIDDGQTTYWDGKPDNTFGYLCELIPEIKLLTPTLMQLDWVNGYSLNSTDPRWASPCPHAYVMDVSGVSYMDLGLFDHPYEPVGVEYFMLVNREGIADMTNRTVTVALDAAHWPQEDSLLLTDIANKEHPQTLKRDGDRFVFTQVFEPGEGKLYRVAPVTEPPITMLHR